MTELEKNRNKWLTTLVSDLHFHVFICSYHVCFGLQTQVSMPPPRITGYLHTSFWSRATALCICMHDRYQEAFVWRMCTPCTNGLGEQHLCKVMYKSIGVQLELDDWFFGAHVSLCASWHTCTLYNRKYSWRHKILLWYSIQRVRQNKATCCPAGTE